jgi:hypothetical protein
MTGNKNATPPQTPEEIDMNHIIRAMAGAVLDGKGWVNPFADPEAVADFNKVIEDVRLEREADGK